MKKLIAVVLLAVYCFALTSCISINGEESPLATGLVWTAVALVVLGGGGGIANSSYTDTDNVDGIDDGGSMEQRDRDYFAFTLNGIKIKMRNKK
jgi:hypothetical protein